MGTAVSDHTYYVEKLGERDREIEKLRRELTELRATIDLPDTKDFMDAVVKEAAFQRTHWGSEHDSGKEAADWLWLIGHLVSKAMMAAVRGDAEKAVHHTISSAAVLANWHASLTGASTDMRPGIKDPDGGGS
jgi:predicted nuclease with TOPRIM domain